MSAQVRAVAASAAHGFHKDLRERIVLIEGIGVEGDAHAGVTVKHRSRVAADPTQPNLRQVHLIHEELFAETAAKGFNVSPGNLGENITTAGLDLLALPRHTLLEIGESAIVEVTGLRNPCHQIDDWQKGLLHAVLEKGADGGLVRKSGIMGIVRAGGEVRPGDAIRVILPEPPFLKLERV